MRMMRQKLQPASLRQLPSQRQITAKLQFSLRCLRRLNHSHYTVWECNTFIQSSSARHSSYSESEKVSSLSLHFSKSHSLSELSWAGKLQNAKLTQSIIHSLPSQNHNISYVLVHTGKWQPILFISSSNNHQFPTMPSSSFTLLFLSIWSSSSSPFF